MALTLDEVARIAHLARLELTSDELAHFQEQLSAVLDYAARLNELDLADVEPSAHAVARRNVMRDDEIRPSLSPDDALFNAAMTAQNQFLIQSVLED